MSVDLVPAIDYDQMMDGLEKDDQGVFNRAEDLTTATYERDSEFGSLSFPGSPKLELNEWSARQLCKKAGIPFSVFRKASQALAQNIYTEFSKGITDPQVKLVVKKYSQKEVLRGILPTAYPDVKDSEVLGVLRRISASLPFVVQYAGWTDQAHPQLRRTRVVFTKFFMQVKGEELLLGLDIVSSEVGGAPLSMNVVLFRPVCTNGAIAVYGSKPYFYFDYSHDLAYDLSLVLDSATQRLTGDVKQFSDRVEAAILESVNKQQAVTLLNDLMTKGHLNKGVMLKALGEIEKTGVNNMWDIVNSITASARGFRDQLRLKYELTAGRLLGLKFTRPKDEDKFAEKAMELPDLPMLPAPGTSTIPTA